MKPFFFFSFLPLLWQWPGKMMPSSVFPRPLLKGVRFQTAGSIIKKNSCLSMMPGSPWSTSLSLLTTPNLGNLVSGLPAKKLYMRKGQNCLGGLQTLSLASMAVAFPVLSQDSNGNYQEAFSVQGFLPLKECGWGVRSPGHSSLPGHPGSSVTSSWSLRQSVLSCV